jgi:integrase
MATIRKRGARQWEAQIRRYGWPTVSKTFTCKADAAAWTEIIESEMTRGIYIDRSEAEKNTLGDLLQRYLRDVTPHKKGADSEAYRINSLLKDPVTQYKVAALSSSIMSTWRDNRLKLVSGSTTNRDLNLLSHVINIARKEWGVHVENPISMIRRPSENRARDRRLTDDEESRLLSALEATERDDHGRFTGPQNIWIKPIVILAIETAMRRSEILSMRWEHVHIQNRYVRLQDTKNGDRRDVPLTSKALAVLQSLPREIEVAPFGWTECFMF